MPNEWIEKLKRFNADGGVWAIPKRNTDERKMLDRGQRFKYTLLKERFPELSRQLEEEVSSREAKAKMRKAEELIKQAEAIDNVVKKRKLRKAPEEEQPPSLESAEAPIRPENKKRETEESKTKTDAVAGKIKDSIYNKMEAKTENKQRDLSAKAYVEYYDYENRLEYVPNKIVDEYLVDEAIKDGTYGEDRKPVGNTENQIQENRNKLHNKYSQMLDRKKTMTRKHKGNAKPEYNLKQLEERNQKQYDDWLKGIDDEGNPVMGVEERKKAKEIKIVKQFLKRTEEQIEDAKDDGSLKRVERLEQQRQDIIERLEELENKPKKRKLRKSTEE